MKKPFKESDLGKFLASKGLDHVLEIVGSIVPGVKILDTVKDMVIGEGATTLLTPADKEQFLKLLDAEQRLLDSQLNDTANARQRQVELAKSGAKDYMFPMVTIFILGMFALVVATHLFFPLRVSTVLAGYEETIKNLVLLIGGYFFGSSRGSREKTKLLSGNE